jgi:hypothetical protein
VIVGVWVAVGETVCVAVIDGVHVIVLVLVAVPCGPGFDGVFFLHPAVNKTVINKMQVKNTAIFFMICPLILYR